MTADLARLAIHTQTIRSWDLRTCCAKFAAAGVAGIGVWRHLIDPAAGGVTPEEGSRILADSGLRVPSLVRAGFFVSPDAQARSEAIEDARRAIEEAATIGAAHVVMVVGAHPRVPLGVARGWVQNAMGDLAPHAANHGVGLAIEPVHPQYAADRSCVCTIAKALEICEAIDHPALGVAVDVYHVWWDPKVEEGIAACGRAGRLMGFHICDWKPDQADPLNDRGLMGDGCIEVARLGRVADEAGFAGVREVEVFSDHYWAMNADEYLKLIIERYRAHCPES